MAVSIVIDITQNSQNVANNTSNVTVKVNAKWTGGSYNLLQKSGTCTIDGTQYSFTSPFNTGETTSGSSNLFTKTLDIVHNIKGEKTLAVSATYNTGVSSGTVAASASKALTTIPRGSTLAISGATLGSAQTLTVTKTTSSYTHTITLKCGSSNYTICTKSSSTSISYTPPLELAATNTTGTSVSATYTITTYNSSGSNMGSISYTKTLSIPASVKPSCSLTVTDPTGYKTKFGAFVQGASKFSVSISATIAQGSAISAYSAAANGVTYTSASFTTDVIKAYGTQSITATVTDKRGRQGTAAASGLTVLSYSRPNISAITAQRCNADGTINASGTYIKVVFSASITNLNSKNTASYVLEYKRNADSTYPAANRITLSSYANQLSLTNAQYIFAADASTAFDVRVTATDAIGSTAKATTASSSFKYISQRADGRGIAFGKVAELNDVFDVGWQARMSGGFLYPVLEPNTDLNAVMTPNTYTGANISNYSYANCPVSSGTFTLLVECCGEDGQVKQTYTTCSKYKPERYSRFYYQGAWGPWFWANTDEYILYENNSGGEKGTVTLAAAASHFRYIEIYFTDNNEKSGGYTKVYSPNGKTVCLQITEASSNPYTRQTHYEISGTTMTPDTTNAGFIKWINSEQTNLVKGANYIRIVRVIGRA